MSGRDSRSKLNIPSLLVLVASQAAICCSQNDPTATSPSNLTGNNATATAAPEPSSTNSGNGSEESDSLKWIIFGAVAGALGLPLICLCLYFIRRSHQQRRQFMDVQERRQAAQAKRTDPSAKEVKHTDRVFDFNYTPSTNPLPQRATFTGPALEEFDENVLRPPSDTSSAKVGSASSLGSGRRAKGNVGPNGMMNHTSPLGSHSDSGGRLTVSNGSARIAKPPQQQTGSFGRSPTLAPTGAASSKARNGVGSRVSASDDDDDDTIFALDDHTDTGPVTVVATKPGASTTPISMSDVSVRGSRNNSRE